MPKCTVCKSFFGFMELNGGLCKKCLSEIPTEPVKKQPSSIELKNILLTTENDPDINIVERIEIISAECVYGMNIFRDIFAGVRDIVGGRSDATQKVLRDARRTVLLELKKEAHAVGANAVVAVDLDYSEFSGGGKAMLFVVATGTAVKIRDLTQ